MAAGSEGLQVDALLVGYERQENLGLRSIKAYLDMLGRNSVLVPFSQEHQEAIVAAALRYKPRLIGFSLIFQYSLDEFGRLLTKLRDSGVPAHLTAGGHFPSLRPEQTMGLLPELDSVVRFEGELTFAELLEDLDNKDSWCHIAGLAYRDNGEVVTNELRPLIQNLDELPPVFRDDSQCEDTSVKSAAMLASRGCLFNCSFCSIRQFYGASKGSLRRCRSPRRVVEEMVALHTERGVRFFSFQDDDFAARTAQQREWLEEFLRQLEQSGIARDVRWKISCRVDDLEAKLLERMILQGLFAVYLGVESGSESGLITLNKRVTVSQNLAAVELLKVNEIAMAMGFMLFEPSSTFETIRENLAFLRAVGADGYFAINFCKMLPYAGTPIEADLKRQGRLTGTTARPDYSFLTPELDCYAYLVYQIFTRRNFNADGLVCKLQQVSFDLRLRESLGIEVPDGWRERIARITRETNILALETLSELVRLVATFGVDELLEARSEDVSAIAEREWRGEMRAEVELRRWMSSNMLWQEHSAVPV